MSANASIEIRRGVRKNCQLIAVSGYMGNDEWAKLENLLEKLFEQGHRRVVLNMASLGFVTTTSLERLAKLERWFAREGGAVRLCGVSSRILQLVDLAGLKGTLTICGTVELAVASILSDALMDQPAASRTSTASNSETRTSRQSGAKGGTKRITVK